MDFLACLTSFVRTVDTGSFSAVAREMSSSQSAVTRQVGQLEEHFGVRLLHRTTRRLTLTDEGRLLLDHARQLLDDAGAIDDLLGRQKTSPTGLVRFALPSPAAHFLAARLPLLFERYPGMSVDLDISDQRHDLIEGGIDVALRAGDSDDLTLIARRIGSTSPILVASPAYIQRNGVPETPDDLSNHVCIRTRGSAADQDWHLVGPDGPAEVTAHGPVSVNNIEIAAQVALGGSGIALLPIFSVVDYVRSGRLVRVLPAWSMRGLTVNLVYPSRRHLPSRTRVFMDFVAEQFKDTLAE